MRLRRYWFFPILLALGVVGLAACGSGDDDSGNGDGVTVMTSTTIMSDLVGQVGGDHVDVKSLVPRNADVHTFSLAPGDIRELSAADIVFVGGTGLEAGFSNEIERNAGGPVVELTEGMALKPFAPAFAHSHGDEEGHDPADDADNHEHDADDDHDEDTGHEGGVGTLDPHFWMDVGLTIEAVGTIRDSLTELDPDHGADYEANAAAYIAELEALDAEMKAALATLPENRHYLVTFHDAFGYFADRYGLTVLGFVVESSEEEPAAGDYSKLVDAIREYEVPYIFVEPQFDSRIVQQLADDTGAEVRNIPNDALTDDYPTYIDLMRGMADAVAH